MSPDGKVKLNEDLQDFTVKARQRQESYMAMYASGLNITADPLWVTEEERQRHHDVQRKTKTMLQEEIFLHIDQLGEPRRSLFTDKFNKVVKKGTKEKYIDFLNELEAAPEIGGEIGSDSDDDNL